MTAVDDRPTSVTDRPAAAPPSRDTEPVPRGWGSHEERRLVLWGVAGYFLLGLYAVAFVLIGQLVWSA